MIDARLPTVSATSLTTPPKIWRVPHRVCVDCSQAMALSIAGASQFRNLTTQSTMVLSTGMPAVPSESSTCTSGPTPLASFNTNVPAAVSIWLSCGPRPIRPSAMVSTAPATDSASTVNAGAMVSSSGARRLMAYATARRTLSAPTAVTLENEVFTPSNAFLRSYAAEPADFTVCLNRLTTAAPTRNTPANTPANATIAAVSRAMAASIGGPSATVATPATMTSIPM